MRHSVVTDKFNCLSNTASSVRVQHLQHSTSTAAVYTCYNRCSETDSSPNETECLLMQQTQYTAADARTLQHITVSLSFNHWMKAFDVKADSNQQCDINDITVSPRSASVVSHLVQCTPALMGYRCPS